MMRMKRVIRICWILSIIIIIGGMTTCTLGQYYAVRKIQPEARITADTDTAGFGWAILGAGIFLVGLIGFLLTGILVIVHRVLLEKKGQHDHIKEGPPA